MKLVRAKILGPDFREDEPERAAIGDRYGPDKDRLTKWLNEFAPRKRIINKEGRGWGALRLQGSLIREPDSSLAGDAGRSQRTRHLGLEHGTSC
jgi:hypothetical protein